MRFHLEIKKTKLHFEAKQYFKKFIYINNLSNKEVMKICDDLNIDIAIDLCGLTAENRIGLFANRIAPTQINYLGYPGTSGANFMDYIIADENIIPNNLFSGYSEKSYTFRIVINLIRKKKLFIIKNS